MMNMIPIEITGITHPLIQSMYVMTVRSRAGQTSQVLVAHTNIRSRDAFAGAANEKVWDLMSELPHLEREASRQNGPIDYLEIRYAS